MDWQGHELALALIVGGAVVLASSLSAARPLAGWLATLAGVAGLAAVGLGFVMAWRRIREQRRAGRGRRRSRRGRSRGGVPAFSAAAGSAAAGSVTGSSPPSDWASSVLESIRQERFERLIAKVFEAAGFECRIEAHGPGQAADIWLGPRGVAAEGAGIVRCRIQQNRRIGVAQLEELAALMRTHGLAQGHYATNGRFEPAALEFARAHGIVALDGKALLERIDAQPPAQRQALLELARTGARRKPVCPRCGALMRRHRARDGRRTFWVCADVSGCTAAQAGPQA